MIPHSHLAHRKCDLFHIRWAQIMVSSQADSGAGRALLTAIVTWISASFELPPDYNHASIKLVPAVQMPFALELEVGPNSKLATSRLGGDDLLR